MPLDVRKGVLVMKLPPAPSRMGVVLGGPGSGKSTVLWWIASRYCKPAALYVSPIGPPAMSFPVRAGGDRYSVEVPGASPESLPRVVEVAKKVLRKGGWLLIDEAESFAESASPQGFPAALRQLIRYRRNLGISLMLSVKTLVLIPHWVRHQLDFALIGRSTNPRVWATFEGDFWDPDTPHPTTDTAWVAWSARPGDGARLVERGEPTWAFLRHEIETPRPERGEPLTPFYG